MHAIDRLWRHLRYHLRARRRRAHNEMRRLSAARRDQDRAKQRLCDSIRSLEESSIEVAKGWRADGL